MSSLKGNNYTGENDRGELSRMAKNGNGSLITTVGDDKKRGSRESRICLPTLRVCGSQFFGEIRT